MDVRMPDVDGLEATRRLVALGTTARILILTTFDLDEYVYDAIRAGASGFLLKDVQPAAARRRDPRRRGGRRAARARPSRGGCSSASPRRCPTPEERAAGARHAHRARAATCSSCSRSGLSNAEIADAPLPQRDDGQDARLEHPRASSTCATACRRSCSPTRPGSCAPRAADLLLEEEANRVARREAPRACGRPYRGAATPMNLRKDST